MITTQQAPKVKTNQQKKTTKTSSQTRQRKTTTRQTKTEKPKASAKKVNPTKADIPLEDVFTANATKGLVLLLIMAFNVTTLRNSFLLVAPKIGFSGNLTLDAWLYGFAMSVLMIIILFHEENWNKAFCPGAIVLYVNALVLTLYMKWFDFMLGEWLAKWLLSGMLILMPVMGMFIVVVMLKVKK
ncbi:hypothetical protein [Microscilla marina]|uniref:Uncharacterized protein n=1 Tax=Microscilla marina ATCC 23134 TaxID=313606 RepID=A1ZSG1_MICM2|nr:hypothetical protein [Microscilla marina]EAY26709.1 hypothetical protein M23134_02960 [Microscilla marina ATCC 23134]